MTVEAPPAARARPAPTGARTSSPALPVLFSVTAFTGAALLFLVEPLVAKLLLPSYGGAATVWATATLFFQAILLAAYVFVHATSRLGARRQPYTLLPIVLLALLVLPLALPSGAAPEEREPVTWLLRTLVLMVGLPFAVLSTTGPLLQRWYAWTDAPRSQDPYFLYAASNVGSFLGLLSYPFLVEPNLDLASQRATWSWAFAVFALLVVACGVAARQGVHGSRHVESPVSTDAPVAWSRRLRWVAVAFLPSSLMLGVTTHITTDIAAIPLIWVVPLALYLLTMVVTFAGRRRAAPLRTTQLAVVGVVVLAISLLAGSAMPVPAAVALDLIILILVGLAAHAHLASDRPDPRHLTLFYVCISLGGAAGGLLNGVVAPLVLERPWEYPLVLALTPLLLVAIGRSRTIAAFLVLMLLGVAVVSEVDHRGNGAQLSRTFYGSYVVAQTSDLSYFVHGTTLHGTQFRDERAGEPTTYYSRGGPLGDVFKLPDLDKVAAVGLGVGTLAAYGQTGQEITFVEIDPEVIRIARDSSHFTYLRDSAAEIRTIAGDGRLAVEQMAEGSLDLIVLDAFSSDSIPVHLLTREAIGSYMEQLDGDGVLAVHITNRVFDLAPVLVDAASQKGLRVLTRAGGEGPGSQRAQWVVLTASPAQAALLAGEGWKDIAGTETVRWTDDYSSVLDVLR